MSLKCNEINQHWKHKLKFNHIYQHFVVFLLSVCTICDMRTTCNGYSSNLLDINVVEIKLCLNQGNNNTSHYQCGKEMCSTRYHRNKYNSIIYHHVTS